MTCRREDKYGIEVETEEEYWRDGIRHYRRWFELVGTWDTKEHRDDALRSFRKRNKSGVYRKVDYER